MRRLHAPESWVERIRRSVAHLGSRFGVLLVQLPPSAPADHARLGPFLRCLPRGLRVAVEFRHPGWHLEDVYGLLEQHGAAYCVMSGARLSCVPRYPDGVSRPSRLTDGAEEQFWLGVREAERFFMGDAEVQKALQKLVTTLDGLGIAYAIIGAMALNEFGYRRVTVDVDVLLTREGLAGLKAATLGRGYIEKFPGSRGLRDPEHGVDIDVVLSGSYPGDGKPKPVIFPDPGTGAERGARVALLPLPTLLELKLASGMTAPDRLKDLADVQEIIRIRRLPRTLADELNPFVRDRYLELWQAVEEAPRE